MKTAEDVAGELGTSEATIERNAQRAEVYDSMLDIGDEQAAEAAKTLPQKEADKLLIITLRSPHNLSSSFAWNCSIWRIHETLY